MRWMPLRERPRRGARRGSRRARAGAAACLATLVFSVGAPGPAMGYRCEETAGAGPRSGLTSEDCRVPADEPNRDRASKRGSMSSLAVLVLAVAGVSLIPIGARGIPSSVDPYRYEEPYE